MSDLPIQLKFFKKLELYQELKKENKKASYQIHSSINDWKTEKEILKWTVNNYHRLGNSISPEFASENIFHRSIDTNILRPVFTNLVRRHFAEYRNKSENLGHLLFTPIGLLIGEVIYECEGDSKWWIKKKYPLFILSTWITIIAGVIITVLTAINLIIKSGLSILQNTN